MVYTLGYIVTTKLGVMKHLAFIFTAPGMFKFIPQPAIMSLYTAFHLAPPMDCLYVLCFGPCMFRKRKDPFARFNRTLSVWFFLVTILLFTNWAYITPLLLWWALRITLAHKRKHGNDLEI